MPHYTMMHDWNDDFRGLDALGQSAPAVPAVAELQRALRLVWERTGNNDYFPGPDDGQYGLNTHAAILRMSRDYLESDGTIPTQYRSTCNTLSSSAKGVCGADLKAILSVLPGRIPELSLSSNQIVSIVEAYGLFLDAYIAEHGDSGAPATDEPLPSTGETVVDTLPPPVDDSATASAEPPVQKVGFGTWLAVLLVLGVGGAGIKLWYDNHKKKQRELLPGAFRKRVKKSMKRLRAERGPWA
jgi:hypothetical protein